MNTLTVEQLIRDVAGRHGAVRLLRQLGFPEPPKPNGLRRHLPGDVHVALATEGDIVRACLVELRGDLDGPVIRDVTRGVRTWDPIAFHLVLVAARGYTRFALACDDPERGPRYLLIERAAVRTSDVDVIGEMLPPEGESGSALAVRFARALDRSRVSQRFFRDVTGMRDLVARAWTGLPRSSAQHRDALALLLLSRLMFLYFLQRRGTLAGDAEFLPNLVRRAPARADGTTIYRSSLRNLFFGVLNRRPEKRTAAARALGDLPYLNGGLFEEHRLELRHPQLDLPDAWLERVFGGLLEKYRFTTSESAEAQRGGGDGVGIDPEMLGRIFEGLMPGEERGRTGTFYSPPAIVDRVVVDTLAEHLGARCGIGAVGATRLLTTAAAHGVAGSDPLARELRTLRVLDPACGSGAFLVGALSHIAALREALGEDRVEVRRDIVARSLHGVDLLEDAALICSLRLWLSLIPAQDAGVIPPLPNLDRRIRQGDALIDPLDLRGVTAGHMLDVPASPALRDVLARLEPLAERYVRAEPGEKAKLRRDLGTLERRLARIWTRTLVLRLEHLERELRARAQDRDLFGDPLAHATTAARRIAGVSAASTELHVCAQEIEQSRALPFFSFRVHFAEAAAGFDIVLSNPPWVRAHRWPAAVRRILRERYRVCADAGWPEAARLTGSPAAVGAQVDLSLLFLERSTELLASGGTLGMLLPAKLFRSLYAGGARALIGGSLRVISIEDHSLDHRAIFDADAFTSVLIAQRGRGGAATSDMRAASKDVRVTMTRAGIEPLRFSVPAQALPMRRGDERAPWLLAPPECMAAFRTMQQSPPLGEDAGLSIHRGVMTGCNDVLVLEHVEPKLGDLAFVRAEGHTRRRGNAGAAGFSGYIEASSVRPMLRGTDIGPFRIRVQRHVLWVPANDDASIAPPARTRRFLMRHRQRLFGERAVRTSELGVLHRLSDRTLGHKVVWSDVARNLRAAAVPAAVRTVVGTDRPIIPLNTSYFVATRSYRESLLLAAYLNSTPVRTFVRAIAERAKDAHFRFFAWTVAVLPLPTGWREGVHAAELLQLSERAHERGALLEHEQDVLDDVVSDAYRLTVEQRTAVRGLDAWFNGPEVERT